MPHSCQFSPWTCAERTSVKNLARKNSTLRNQNRKPGDFLFSGSDEAFVAHVIQGINEYRKWSDLR